MGICEHEQWCLISMVSHSGPSQTRAPSVVVLSADEMLRDAVAYWFKSLEILTVATADGYEANRVIEEGGVRLLITDRVLPPWPGLDTFPPASDR